MLQLFEFEPMNKALSFPRDLYAIPTALLCWGILHKTLQVLIFNPAGKVFFPDDSKKKQQVLDNERLKFYTAAWKAVYYSICSILGGYIMVTESEWFFDPQQYFVGWPNQPMSDPLKYYYVMEMAGYIYSTLIMPFEAKQTKADYFAYMIHHGSTLFLMWVSYIYSFHRIGVVIAFLHDLADPWMEYAKIVLYSGRIEVADVMFGIFAVIFLVTRNFIFPYYVILSIPKYCRYPNGDMLPSNGMNYALQMALWTLEALHVYWGGLILKMAYKAILKGGVEDDCRNIEVDGEHITAEAETAKNK